MQKKVILLSISTLHRFLVTNTHYERFFKKSKAGIKPREASWLRTFPSSSRLRNSPPAVWSRLGAISIGCETSSGSIIMSSTEGLKKQKKNYEQHNERLFVTQFTQKLISKLQTIATVPEILVNTEITFIYCFLVGLCVKIDSRNYIL